MTHCVCPICDTEVYSSRDCSHHDPPSFSLELELLNLSFDLEPYGREEELDKPSPIVLPERNSKRTPFLVRTSKISSVPLFLRL